MRALQTAIAVAVIAVISLACGRDEEAAAPAATSSPTSAPVPSGAWTAPSGTPVPKPGWRPVRFLNVTASAPENVVVALLAGYTFSPTDFYDRPVITIEPRGVDDVRAVIDAQTGALVTEVGSEQERTVLQPTLDTVRLSPFDPKAAPWPYADTPPPDTRVAWGSITYPVPDASSGVDVDTASGIGASAGVCGHTVIVSNGRSKMVLNACTGEPIPYATNIDPGDSEAFERFRTAVKVEP